MGREQVVVCLLYFVEMTRRDFQIPVVYVSGTNKCILLAIFQFHKTIPRFSKLLHSHLQK